MHSAVPNVHLQQVTKLCKPISCSQKKGITLIVLTVSIMVLTQSRQLK
jgi:hypothetical protein